jgi:hypothetical protein
MPIKLSRYASAYSGGVTRNRHPAETSLDIKSRALVPPNADRLDEIVEEIVDHQRPWKDRKSRAAITAEVGADVIRLLILAPYEAKRGDRKKNRTHARQLDQALLNVQNLLTSAPLPLQSFLLDPLPNTTDDGVIHGVVDEEIERANRKRADSFDAELKRLRQVCARAIKVGYGYDSNYDRAKHLCAGFAQGLVRELSAKPVTGTMDAPFRAIASVLYEAVSGRRDVDLKRACDSQLREIRGSTTSFTHIYEGASHLFDLILDPFQRNSSTQKKDQFNASSHREERERSMAGKSEAIHRSKLGTD